MWDRSIDKGSLPSGAKAICIGTNGTSGCLTAAGERVEVEAWWERDAKDVLHFVTKPHGCGNCIRPCVPDILTTWRILTKKEVPQTSAPTANKWIKER
jgi:hypothetical protein